MPFSSVKDFVKSFPSIKGLTQAQQKKCLEIFNALKKQGMADGKAIATAMTKAKQAMMDETLHFVAPITLSEDSTISDIEVLRVGVIQDRMLEITKSMLEDYVRNFNANVYGTELQINLEHNRGSQAAGWITNLYLNGDSLMAKVDWTVLGTDMISKKLYKFVSSELAPQYPHCDTGILVSNVFIGAALTNTPALKRQQPIALSEQDKALILNSSMFKKYIEDLKQREKLSAKDVEFARSLLSEVAPEDAEQAQADVADLEKKQQEQAEAEAKAAEDAKQAADAEAKAKADEAAKLAEQNKGTVSLEEYNRVKSELEVKTLTEDVTKSLVLSDKNKDVAFGFLDEDVPAVVGFMQTLSDVQRAAFKGIVAKVKSVDFSTRGGNAMKTVNLSGDTEDQIVALADKFMAEDKNLTVGQAQHKAKIQLGLVKE